MRIKAQSRSLVWEASESAARRPRGLRTSSVAPFRDPSRFKVAEGETFISISGELCSAVSVEVDPSKRL
jgi:hypothetical protein